MDQYDIATMYKPIEAVAEAERAWSAQQAEKAMQWQERMSDTAHQREVKDLIAAGLNPVLSAGGQGAAVGTGHAANSSGAGVTALYGLISKAFEAQIKQAEALETTAKKVEQPVGTGGDGTAAPVGQLTTPKETMTKKERFDRDKATYGTEVAYKLADTEDPWLREKIMKETGKGDYAKEKEFKDIVAQELATIVSKGSFGWIDKTAAKKVAIKFIDALDKPIDKLVGKLSQKKGLTKVEKFFVDTALAGTGLTPKMKKKEVGSKFQKETGTSGRKGKF